MKTAEQAKRIHSDPRNIQVIAIGVAGANLTELELIATTKEQVFFLDNFAAFDLVQETIAESICDAPILSEDGAIVGIVVGGTETSEFDGILNGNVDINSLFPGGIAPGIANFQLTMAGRTFIKIKSSQKLDFYLSYTQTNPSPSRHDFLISYTETMAEFEVEVDLQARASRTSTRTSTCNISTRANASEKPSKLSRERPISTSLHTTTSPSMPAYKLKLILTFKLFWTHWLFLSLVVKMPR